MLLRLVRLHKDWHPQDQPLNCLNEIPQYLFREPATYLTSCDFMRTLWVGQFEWHTHSLDTWGPELSNCQLRLERGPRRLMRACAS